LSPGLNHTWPWLALLKSLNACVLPLARF
jgi:hypothetical protein